MRPKQRIYPVVSEHDTIYMAGLFDGEGSITLSINNARSGGYVHPQILLSVSLTNTHEGVMRWMCSTFRGGLAIYNNLPTSNPRHATAWKWRLQSRDAAWFLRLLYPYLVVKKEQATIALEFQDHVTHHGRIRRPGHHAGFHPLAEEEVSYRYAMIERLSEIRGRDKQYLGR